MNTMSDYKCWSKRISTPEMEKTMEVEEIENGFIVTIYEHKNNSEDYKPRRKVFSKSNPLADLEPKITTVDVEEFFNPPIFQG